MGGNLKIEKYLSLLIEQYKQATGIKNVDINSQSFMSEFSEWIKSRQNISNNYLDLLEYMELSQISDPDTAEVGKGQYDILILEINLDKNFQTCTTMAPLRNLFELIELLI